MYSKMKSILSSAAYLIVLFFSANVTSNNNNGLRTSKAIVGRKKETDVRAYCLKQCSGSPDYNACMCDCDPNCDPQQYPKDLDDYDACMKKYCALYPGFIGGGHYDGINADCECYCNTECSCNFGACGGGPINDDGTEITPKPGCMQCGFGDAPAPDDGDDDPTSTS